MHALPEAEPIATPVSRPDPAIRAANAARVLGGLITLVAVLGLASSLFAGRARGGVNVVIVAVGVVLFYAAPGIALLVMSGGVRRGAKGRTIAVLVLSSVIACFVWLGLAMLLLNTSVFRGGMLLPLGFILIVALVATLLAVYCIQSLRFPDRIDPKRGFEPLMVATPLQTASDVDIPSRAVR